MNMCLIASYLKCVIFKTSRSQCKTHIKHFQALVFIKAYKTQTFWLTYNQYPSGHTFFLIQDQTITQKDFELPTEQVYANYAKYQFGRRFKRIVVRFYTNHISGGSKYFLCLSTGLIISSLLTVCHKNHLFYKQYISIKFQYIIFVYYTSKTHALRFNITVSKL